MRTFNRILTFIGGSVRRLVVLLALAVFFGGQLLGLWDSPSLVNLNVAMPPAVTAGLESALAPPPAVTSAGAEVWTPAGDEGGQGNAERHFKKHGAEFPFGSEEAYVRAALSFVTSPPPGTLSVVQSDGDHVFYHPGENYFAVTRRDGKIRTFFRPDPKIHGYPDNMAYFHAQEGR